MSLVLFPKFSNFCEIHEFGKICEIHELWEIGGFHDCCSGTGCAISHWTVRKIVLCIACFAYSITITIVIVIIIVVVIIIISFIVLLNCLYLNPGVLLFVHSSPHRTGWGGGVSEQLHGPSCQMTG